jgi:hypothetical protein
VIESDRAKRVSNAIDVIGHAGGGAFLGLMAVLALRMNGIEGLGGRENVLFGVAGIGAAMAYRLAGGTRTARPPHLRLLAFVLGGGVGGAFLALVRAVPTVAPSTYTVVFGCSCGAALGALGGFIDIARNWRQSDTPSTRKQRLTSWTILVVALGVFAAVLGARPDAV